MTTISEVAFKFSRALNEMRGEYPTSKINNLQKYVRDQMFYAIKHKVTTQEYYLNTKIVIEQELSTRQYAG